MLKQCYSSTVSRQQLCECFSFFFYAAQKSNAESNDIWSEACKTEKNTSRPNRCTTCGPFVNLFAMGTFLMLAKLICRCVLTYVRLGVCTVGTATGFQLPPMKFKCWFSPSTDINPVFIHWWCVRVWKTTNTQCAAHRLFAFPADLMNENIYLHDCIS